MAYKLKYISLNKIPMRLITMKTQLISVIFICLLFSTNTLLFGQDSLKTTKKNPNQETIMEFVDEDGDGYNDLAQDHDGDGIPNALDPDYLKLQKEKGKAAKKKYIDLDGDGINDLLTDEGEAKPELPQMMQQQQQQQQRGSLDQNDPAGKGGQRKEKQSGGKK